MDPARQAFRPQGSRLARGALGVLLVLAPMGSTGCFSSDGNAPGSTAVNDPLEPVNRIVFDLNEIVDALILSPVSSVYRFVTPEVFRTVVGNVSRNLKEPVIGLNQALQGKGEESLNDFTRFFVNSTFGIAGLFDVASGWGYPKHQEDLGQTLAVWGLDAGPYLVVPLFGPMTLRHVPGRASENLPRYFVLNGFDDDIGLIGNAVFFVDERAAAESRLANVREQAIDPYLFVREAYYQRREFLVFDGEPPVGEIRGWGVEIPEDTPAADAPAQPGRDEPEQSQEPNGAPVVPAPEKTPHGSGEHVPGTREPDARTDAAPPGEEASSVPEGRADAEAPAMVAASPTTVGVFRYPRR
jgi:phospholipid-binding lipoprotein MlaA